MKIKKCKELQKSLKNSGFMPVKGCGQLDSTLFGVIDGTTTTKFSGLTCAVHCISLLVVVDKAIIMVLKFPNNQGIIPSTGVMQLTLTMKMTTAQVFETLVTVNSNSPIQDYVHPGNQTQPTFEYQGCH